MKFCLGPFARTAKARVGLGQLKTEGSKWKLTSEGSKNKNEMNFCPFALVLRAYAAAATKQKQGHACAAQLLPLLHLHLK
jgi:hypothetical protein